MGNIFIFEDAYPELFVSHSYVDFEVADADGGHRHLITLTGVVLLKDISTLPPVDERTRPYYKGITSDAWRQDVLYLEPLLPEDLVPQGKWFDVHQCAPFVTINAIFNQDQAINAGWAVDTCELTAQLPYKIGKGGAGCPFGLTSPSAIPMESCTA